MILRKWEDLPDNMKNDSVRKYYEALHKKKFSIYIKRVFDFIAAALALILLSPLFVVISIAIKIDSKGPVMFRQIRVTQYGKQFRIFKFRTMVNNAEKIGSQVTVKNDSRVTKVGRFLRKYRLDEIPQLLNIIQGDMSFVGTRPEVVKYVKKYTDEMMATLLLPAGVTSEASIRYKDEGQLLDNVNDTDEIYVSTILPNKMKINLDNLEKFSFLKELKTMFKTVMPINKKDISDMDLSDAVIAIKREKIYEVAK